MTEDSDNDDVDEQMEHFYDPIIRVPETEYDLLPQLRCSGTIPAWKNRLRCRLLSSDRIDSLLDSDVVDWHELHRDYLESVSNRQATNGDV